MSPRIFIPSGIARVTPPTRRRSSAFFTSSWPKISGAIERASFEYMSSSSVISAIRSAISLSGRKST